ncbi:MAG: electron transfer flavoprotein subunit beta/FixA family protein [Acidimicrobiales bacterium]
MRILVCVKRVPAPGARINVTDDGQGVETAHLGFTTSPHEECAVEEAVLLIEANGGSVTVLTLGPAEAVEQLRYAASVGAQELVLLPTEPTPSGCSTWDPQRTAAALSEAIGEIEAEDGTFDLILFGNESADSGGFQVGVRVAHALGRPIVNGIKDIDITDDKIIARRAVDAGFEVYELPRPAVLGVKEGLNLPRYPTMKGRLASKKVELVEKTVAADAGGQAMIRLHRPAEEVSNTEILADASTSVEEAAVKVVDLLEEIGVLQ